MAPAAKGVTVALDCLYGWYCTLIPLVNRSLVMSAPFTVICTRVMHGMSTATTCFDAVWLSQQLGGLFDVELVAKRTAALVARLDRKPQRALHIALVVRDGLRYM